MNYVGISSNTIAQRQAEHISQFLSGKYIYYDSESIKSGELKRIYHPHDGIKCFIKNLPRLKAGLKEIKLFFVPLREDKILLERIESALIMELRNSDSEISRWMDNDRVSRSKQGNETEKQVNIILPANIQGMPKRILV